MYKQAWRRFYLSKTLPTEGSGWLHGSQLVLMTSTGRLLTGQVNGKNGLAPALKEVLESYAKLPEEERRPKTVVGEEKPVAAPPPGGLVLTIYERPLGRAADGRYRLPEGADNGKLRTFAPHGQRSSLWLTEDECKSLIPQDPQKGQTQKFSAHLTKRICLMGMWPNSLWVVEQAWRGNSFREGELNLTVEDVTTETIRMRVHGSVVLVGRNGLRLYPTGKTVKELDNRYDARLEGVLVYDRAQKRIAKWDMAALGDYTGAWFCHTEGNAGDAQWREATSAAPLPLGFSFELDRSDYEVPAARRRPKSFVHSYIFHVHEQFYWHPDKWEEDWKKQQQR